MATDVVSVCLLVCVPTAVLRRVSRRHHSIRMMPRQACHTHTSSKWSELWDAQCRSAAPRDINTMRHHITAA